MNTELFHIEYTTVVDHRGELTEEQEDVVEDVPVGGSPMHLAGAPATPSTPTAMSSAGSLAGTHSDGGDDGVSPAPASPPPGATVEFESPPSGEPNLDNDHDDAPLHFRKLDNVLGPVEIPGLAE